MPGHLGALVDVRAQLRGAAREPPDHGVVAHDPARGVEHAAEDGEARAVGDVQRRDEFLALLGVDQLAVHPVELGRRHVHAEGLQGRVAVGQVEVPAVVEHQVEVQLFGEQRPEVEGLLVERDVLLGALVGAHDGRVAAGRAAADEFFLDDGHVRDAVAARQEIGRGQPVQPAADDHGVVAGLEGGRFPQPVEFEKHGLTLRVSVVYWDMEMVGAGKSMKLLFRN